MVLEKSAVFDSLLKGMGSDDIQREYQSKMIRAKNCEPRWCTKVVSIDYDGGKGLILGHCAVNPIK